MKMLDRHALVAAALLVIPLAGFSADKNTEKPKPYPVATCVVSGEKLGGMGDPYVFDYKGQEIKLCCKSCLKDFNKDPEKFLKKLADEAKKK